MSDSIGAFSPGVGQTDFGASRPQPVGQSARKQSDMRSGHRAEEPPRRASRSPQGTAFARKSRQQLQEAPQQHPGAEEHVESEAPRDDFQHMTRGNHLLPLQQPHSQVSYVNTIASSYVDTAQQSQPYVDTTAHHTRHTGIKKDYETSQYGSLVRADEAQTNLKESLPSSGANLAANHFDFIDQQRLERALTPGERSQSGRRSAKSPDETGEAGPEGSLQRADSGSQGPASRRQRHFIASNPLRKEKKAAGEYQTHSVSYQALRHSGHRAERSPAESAPETRHYNQPTAKR